MLLTTLGALLLTVAPPEVVGDLTVSAKPGEGVRLELTDANGKRLLSGVPYRNSQAAVGAWKVTAKAAGYEDETQQFRVAPNDVTTIRFDLKRLGALQVTGKPAQAAKAVVERETVGVASGGSAGCPPGMALVPGGSFTMVDRTGQVSVGETCLDVTEVTVDAYGACVTGRKCSAPASGEGCNQGRAGRGNHPVNCVDWSQADTYCRAQGKRLPTEEEWEWAARGGQEGRTWPWGREAPGRKVCWDGAGRDLGKGKRLSTCPVGSFRAGDNPQGVHDLAGNVWEWTASADGAGSYGAGPDRVFRGGGWDSDDPSSLRAAYRNGSTPSAQTCSLGFRCARTP